MYNQNYKVELPQFPDREVSIAEYGAKSGDLQIETGRHNAEAINRAIREVSEQGGGMVRVPAGIWAVAPIRLLSGVNLHLDSQAMLKFIKSKRIIPAHYQLRRAGLHPYRVSHHSGKCRKYRHHRRWYRRWKR